MNDRFINLTSIGSNSKTSFEKGLTEGILKGLEDENLTLEQKEKLQNLQKEVRELMEKAKEKDNVKNKISR